MLSVPIEPKMLSRKAGALAGLPLIVGPRWAYQIDPIAFTAADQEFRLDLPRVDQVDRREQMLVLQRLMNARGHRIIGHRGWGGLHVCDETR